MELLARWWKIFGKHGNLLQKYIPSLTDQEHSEYTKLRRKLEAEKRDIEEALRALGIKFP